MYTQLLTDFWSGSEVTSVSLVDVQREELVTCFSRFFISQALLFEHSGELVSL